VNGGRVLRFPPRAMPPEEIEISADRILALPPAERIEGADAIKLEQPELLLSVCGRLHERLDTSPATVRDDAEHLYGFLRVPARPIGLFDEREYFLGELALIAGTACRHLSRREEARLWFDRAEGPFLHTVSATADLSRLAYQRLALRMEERQLDAVLEMAPPLEESFQKLSMPVDALKVRFLEAIALTEGERLTEASEIYRRICTQAESLGAERLAAAAYGNLTHIYGMQGDAARAIEASRQAIPVLKRLDDRIALAKVQWGLAGMLRETGQLAAALESYRAAQEQFEQIGMRADVAALHLVIADLLLDLGEEATARQAVLEALPVIQELQMVPEGMAALQLLRESLREERIDRPALRELHGYFPEAN